MRIAILEDDPSQAAIVNDALSAAGHSCHAFASGDDLVRRLRRETFDLLVLDWVVPGMSGKDVLHSVRQGQSVRVPVLFVTGYNREADITSMLEAGADDYIVKPVSTSMLLARVGALLRRAYQADAAAVKEVFGDIEFDLKLQRAKVRGEEVCLTQKEFELAILLFRSLGRPLSRAHILDMVWKQTDDVPSRKLDTHISWVRNKLALRPEHGYRITSIYGYGYRLEQLECKA